jgi:hypothetical protein
MTAKNVGEHRYSEPDPQEEAEEFEHGPKDVDEWVIGSKHSNRLSVSIRAWAVV